MPATPTLRRALGAIVFLLWVAVWFCLVLAFAARPAGAQQAVKVATAVARCTDGSPQLYSVVDATSSSDCATGGGSTENICSCLDGVLADFGGSGSGGGNSFETQNAPAGTDPVADSSTDTLNWTAGTGITITGDSSTDTLTVASTIPAITFDIGDDGGNDSVAVAEISTLNDNGSAITEPSADEIQIDVAKLRPPSVLNPRPSPHADDCEFSSGICGSWTLDGGYGSGTVDPLVQVSGGDIYDCSTWPGWCLFQDYTAGASVYKAAVYKSHTPASDETWWFHVTAGGGVGGTNENRVGLCYLNTGDANEEVCAGFHSAGGSERVEIYVNNNGTVTPACGMTIAGPGVDGLVMILRRDSDVYSMGLMRPDGGGGYVPLTANTNAYYCGAVTKTGVTTFDRIALVLGDSNDNPTPPQGVDFIRYAASHTFAFLNP